MNYSLTSLVSMTLPSRLIALRKERGLSQQAMADLIGIHSNSWKKYEKGHVEPSLEVLKKIATTLHTSADFLLFEGHEREPGPDLILQFEAIKGLPANEKMIVKEVIDSLIIKYQTRRWDTTRMVGDKPNDGLEGKLRGGETKQSSD